MKMRSVCSALHPARPRTSPRASSTLHTRFAATPAASTIAERVQRAALGRVNAQRNQHAGARNRRRPTAPQPPSAPARRRVPARAQRARSTGLQGKIERFALGQRLFGALGPPAVAVAAPSASASTQPASAGNRQRRAVKHREIPGHKRHDGRRLPQQGQPPRTSPAAGSGRSAPASPPSAPPRPPAQRRAKRRRPAQGPPGRCSPGRKRNLHRAAVDQIGDAARLFAPLSAAEAQRDGQLTACERLAHGRGAEQLIVQPDGQRSLLAVLAPPATGARSPRRVFALPSSVRRMSR